MFRPQERYFAASMSPRGTIWPFRTGRFSEQRRRAIQWRRGRGAWPKRLLWHPWHNPASGNALPENIGGRQAPSVYRTPFVFRANRARCWSYGRPLGNCNGQLLLPVFLFGTGGSNAARRCEAGPCRFSCGDRENSEARAGSEARGTVATNTVPQIPLACDTLSAERHPAPV